MKRSYSNEHILEDVKMFVIWKTAKLMKEHFNNDIQSFYRIFNNWKKMRDGEHLEKHQFNDLWATMRKLNEFLAIDKLTSRRLTNSINSRSFFQELVEKHDIIFLDKGRLCWHDKEGCIKSQHFGYRYFASIDLMNNLVTRYSTLDNIIDFKNGLYSKRLLKLIAKFSNEAKENKKTKETTMKIQTPEDDIDFDENTLEQKKFINKMQQWVDNKKLGVATARAMLNDAGYSVYAKLLKEPHGGNCYAEIDYVHQTKIMQQYIRIFKAKLDDKPFNKWCKSFAMNYCAYFKGANV